MADLKSIIETYKKLAGGFARPVPLAAFGLDRGETERLFSVFDEDYHISRFFHFSDQRGSVEKSSGPQVAGRGSRLDVYRINGFEHTHVSLDPEIETIL